jgi:hypothetical protein
MVTPPIITIATSVAFGKLLAREVPHPIHLKRSKVPIGRRSRIVIFQFIICVARDEARTPGRTQ